MVTHCSRVSLGGKIAGSVIETERSGLSSFDGGPSLDYGLECAD